MIRISRISAPSQPLRFESAGPTNIGDLGAGAALDSLLPKFPGSEGLTKAVTWAMPPTSLNVAQLE